MKFTDGFWGVREGITLVCPTEAYEVTTTESSMTVYAPCGIIRHRGDTLNVPQLTFEFSSPIPDVIHARISHFQGGLKKGPFFEVARAKGLKSRIERTEDAVSLTSGRISVRVKTRDGWGIDYLYDGKRLTGSGRKHAGYIISTGGGRYMREQLSLAVGECVYGLGERFTPLVRNGQVVDIWNEDGGTCSEQAYKNVPFYLTSAGYGVFVAHPEKVSFEVASEVVSRAQFSVPGEELEYYVIGGGSPKEVLRRYTELTGRPALPPAWSFGLWLTTSFTTNYDEKTVSSFIDGMRDRGIPLHVFHFDCFWMKGFQWCDFSWDREQFPDPEGILRRLKERGLRISVWINPYIAQKSRLFKEGKEHGYLLKKPDGSVWQWDRWQAGMALVDFTNDAAVRWFQEQLRALVRTGVDCFKTDFGERIPTDVVYHNGADPLRMHNYYTYLYNKAVFELLLEERGAKHAVVFARSATAGSQKYPVHWGGDCSANYESMAESLRGGLSLGLSGFGFWSHDISGFEGTPTPDLYKRWTAFGLLSSHSRLHGNESYRVPWLFGEESVDVLRFFAQLKCRLMPYLFAAACDAAREGTPVMRAMILEFPSDPGCAYLDRQYMLGGSLLVAPVFSEEGSVSYYLPAGNWTSFLSGERAQGGGWRNEKHGYLSLPLMVRPNSIIPVGAVDSLPEYDYADGVVFHLFELGDACSASSTIFDTEGKEARTIRIHRGEGVLTIESHGSRKPWSVILRNVANVREVRGGSARQEGTGVLLAPEEAVEKMTVRL